MDPNVLSETVLACKSECTDNMALLLGELEALSCKLNLGLQKQVVE